MQNQDQINQLKNTVQDILDEAVKQGASAAEAGLSGEGNRQVGSMKKDSSSFVIRTSVEKKPR